jgi:hypothetical protein
MTKLADIVNNTLALYADGPTLLDSVLVGLSETDLDLALSTDSWSIRQIVHHLADGDDLWKTCIKAALGNEQGLFSLFWYWDKPQMDWSENWHYADRDIDSSLALLRANRYHVTELINKVPGALQKSIRLQRPEGQEERITIGYVLEMQTRHVSEHIKDIQKICRVHGKLGT